MSENNIERNHDLTQPLETLHASEQLKASSHFLRGTIAEGLENTVTGSLCHDDTLLTKFHGIYQQDDRDIRQQRTARKLEPDYRFMVRLRIPGGILSIEQWQAIHRLSKSYASSGIRITTRQTIQLHGIRKLALRPLIKGLGQVGIDTIAACGDDSRGVICSADPTQSSIQNQVYNLAKKTSQRLIPKTGAYEEIWYRATKQHKENEEPVYGQLYLPRKFKVGYAIPPINDIDVFAQDVGFIAIGDNDTLHGFNLCVGGGMGQLDTREDSYPRLATEIGFIEAADAPSIAEIIMGIQRDYGDRQDRHQARFKYTIDRIGVDTFKELLESRYGKKLEKSKPYTFTDNGDRLGWSKANQQSWQLTLYIESGRIKNELQDQLDAFFQQFSGRIRLTTNQNLQLLDIADFEKQDVIRRLTDIGLEERIRPEVQAAHTISCVALPTCGLAMAEAERYTPDLLEKVNVIKQKHHLENTPVKLRITGCPNGCARPYLAEIALTGRAPGLYNLYLGGSHRGDRLAVLHGTNLNETQILTQLNELFAVYAKERVQDEFFGDFLFRKQLLNVNSHENKPR